MSKSKRSRRQYTTEQKVAFLREHLVDKVPASDGAYPPRDRRVGERTEPPPALNACWIPNLV